MSSSSTPILAHSWPSSPETDYVKSEDNEVIAGEHPCPSCGRNHANDNSPSDWTECQMLVEDSIPYFRLVSSVVAWEVSDVTRVDPNAFNQFFRSFTKWPQFFQSANEELPTQHCLPIMCERGLSILEIKDMKVWQGRLMILLRFEVVMTVEEIKRREDILPGVLGSICSGGVQLEMF